MIDIKTERLLTLKDTSQFVASRFYGKRGSRPLALATVYRWVNRGIRGVRLEVIHVGGGRVTSIEAIERFFDALGGNSSSEAGPRPQPLLPSAPSDQRARQRRVAAAEAALEKMGV